VLLVVGSAYSLHTGNEVNGRRQQLSHSRRRLGGVRLRSRKDPATASQTPLGWREGKKSGPPRRTAFTRSEFHGRGY
jgi:hypothetical protein